jgi:hypothetical protein
MNSKPKKKQLSRRHHIVPKFLLAGFTDTGDRNGKLWRFDTDKIRADEGTVAQFAVIKDFYNVQTESGPDDAYEIAYGKLEHQAAPVVERIRETGQIPSGSDLDALVAFVAFLERRGPDTKAVLDKLVNDMSRFSLELLIHHYDDWSGFQKQQYPDEPLATKEELQEALANGIEFEAHPNLRVPAAWDWATDIYPLLRRRPWCVWTRDPSAPEFICSDCPVGIDNVEKFDGFWQPPPFGPGSLVTLPISKDRVLVSWFDGNHAHVPVVSDQYVAQINLLTGRTSRRWLFAPRPDFAYAQDDGSIGHWADLQAAIRRSRANDD